jgi:hypothetical protein
MTWKLGASGNPRGRPKGKLGIAAMAARATPENIKWLEHVRDAHPSKRVPWSVRMDAVKLLLFYAHGSPQRSATQNSSGLDTPGNARVIVYNSVEATKAAGSDGGDGVTVWLPSNGYEVTKQLEDEGGEDEDLPKVKRSSVIVKRNEG